MSTYSDLVADVITVTNRPDLVDLTKLAVRHATLKAHKLDFFPKDIYETGIQWQTPAYIQSLEYRNLVPRWRALKYLRKYDFTTSPGKAGDIFKVITPELILDDYNFQKDNVCYLAGESLEIRSNTKDANMLLGCYRHPDTTEATYDSWVALDQPTAIVYEAARSVFKQIGYDEQASEMQSEVTDQYSLLRQEIIGEGY